jgi:hypothetical protein
LPPAFFFSCIQRANLLPAVPARPLGHLFTGTIVVLCTVVHGVSWERGGAVSSSLYVVQCSGLCGHPSDPDLLDAFRCRHVIKAEPITSHHLVSAACLLCSQNFSNYNFLH